MYTGTIPSLPPPPSAGAKANHSLSPGHHVLDFEIGPIYTAPMTCILPPLLIVVIKKYCRSTLQSLKVYINIKGNPLEKANFFLLVK